MKFKKVEIQAFRAYEEIANGTFDFNISKDDQEVTADFVSIFAPNGFGKTSFYDAVEYGLTDSIDRFLKNVKLNKEAAKSERQLNLNQKGQYLLRNKYAPDSLDTEINIHFTDSTIPSIKKKIDKANRKGTVDFHFTESRVQNKYFQSVILSQDWIDAFLKVEDPSARYDKFMSYFGDKKLDDYYKKIIELINQNNKTINDIKEKLTGVQQILDFSGDKDILKKVNDKIVELNTLGDKINPILETYSETDSFNLSNFISERLNDINFKNKKQEELLAFIASVFSESTDVVGIENYFNSKIDFVKSDNVLIELQNILENFKKKDKSINELNQITKNQKQLILEKEKIEGVFNHFSDYIQINDEVLKIEEQITKESEKETEIEKEVLNLRILESDQKSKLENLNNQINDLELNIENLPQLNKTYNDNTIKSVDLKNKIDSEELKLKPLLQSRLDLELEIKELDNAVKNIEKKLYPSINEKLFFDSKDLILEIEGNEKDLKERSKSLELINVQIKEQENLNKDIATFILKGAEIIDKTQESTCPLCNFEYTSFKELSLRVANNNLLSDLLSSLAKQRTDIEVQIDSISELLKENIKKITNSLNKNLAEKTEVLSKLSINIIDIEISKKSLTTAFDELKQSLQKFNLMLAGVSYGEFTKANEDQLLTLKKELSIHNQEIEKSTLALNSKIAELEIIENRIKTFGISILELKEKEVYIKITEYYKFEFPNQKIELNLLEKQLITVTDLVVSNITQIDELQKSITDLDEILKKYTKESVDKEVLTKTEEKNSLVNKILSFELDIKSKLELDANGFDKESLIKQLNEKRDSIRMTFENNEQKIKNYNLLIDLKKNVEPYLKYERAKKTEGELKRRKSFLEKKIKKELEKEKNAVSSYLSEQIKSFFYEDIINDIYRRIDPHPDYKKIKFICDFKDDKPKLNVYLLKDELSDDPIIPNLYFSAAQLNILSLSIFLAKALNAKDNKDNPIDCIFIDDPIQSMDSINILSTIDLFRSIMVNHNKQIILSTHDENFHNLLQKKMPSDLFKSKFMELETFGKVKTVYT
ncbi:AAA family ATPase [Flavobacterium degerlachei]|jgi:exonuclease SbcC|uniref:Exonuclease SbcC n=1 Tax=Flavobacterium degerlachei TaxID=229203 RepID=A0A1H3CGD1_9FLAO|nr:AAA family ATPase [Flavobacterium degerlachei]SDX52644.1 exonuclease SbcC [Flavobacterium degerlachei]